MRLILKYKQLLEITQEVEVDLNFEDYGLPVTEDGDLNYDKFYENFNSELYPDANPDNALDDIMQEIGEDAWRYVSRNHYDVIFDLDENVDMEYDFQIYDLEDNLIFYENA